MQKKCLLREPGVAYEATLSRNVNEGFPRQTKHFVGLFFPLIDCIALLRASGCSALNTGGVSSFAGRPRWIWVLPLSSCRVASPAVSGQYLRSCLFLGQPEDLEDQLQCLLFICCTTLWAP